MPVYMRKKRWYVDITIRGQRYRESVPEAVTLKHAQQAEAKLRTSIFEGKYSKPKSRMVFEKYVNEIYLPWSKNNKRSYPNDVTTAKVVCEFFRGKALGEISPFHVEKFKQTRSGQITRYGQTRAKASVNRELAQLSKMFSLAVDYGYIEANPSRRVKLYTVDNARDRVLTPEEEEKLKTLLVGKRSHLREIAFLALYAGMRRGEILKLEWHEVDFGNDLIHLPAEKTKTNRKRDLPMNQMVRAALSEMRQGIGEKASGYVFAGAYCTSNVSAAFSTFAKGIGLEDVTLHTLRHTFATRLKDAGVDPFTIRDLLGHKTIKMTDRYTHANPNLMRQAVNTLGNVPAHLAAPLKSA